MSRTEHEQARELIALSGGQDLTDGEQNWLRVHLQECAACRDYAEAVGQTVSALRSQPLAADFALVEATRLRVRARAVELKEERSRAWLVLLSCLLVGLSAAITTPLFWRAFEWVGQQAGVSNWVWETSFAFFWMVPALVASVVLIARGSDLAGD